MIRIRVALILILSSFLIALPNESTLACSGGGPGTNQGFSIDFMMDWSEYFVKATVIAMDEANQNFILDVISSQKSMPPKQLVLSITAPSTTRAARRFGISNCIGEGTVHYVKVGDTGYFPLQRNQDGSYSSFLQFSNGLVFSHFDNQTFAYTKIDPLGDESNSNSKKAPLPTEDAFIQLVQEKGGTAPVPNTTNISEFMPLPPTAPIYLATDTGKKYMLPMDGGEVVPLEDNWLAKELGIAPDDCYQSDCVLLSPDTSLQLIRKDDHTIFMFPPDNGTCVFKAWACVAIEGQMGIFSTTNDAFAIWNESKIVIYQLINKDGINGPAPMPQKLISIPLKTTPEINIESLHNRAVWSNDGNVLVFADAVGLWSLDLYSDITPHLIIKGNNDRAILPISLTGNGRFLAFSLEDTRQNWILQDMQTGVKYPNLVLSPDGRYGVSFNNGKSTPLNSLLRVIYPQTFPKGGTWDLQWITARHDQHYIKTCGSEIGTCQIQYCGTYVGNLAPIPRPYFCWTDFGELPLNDAAYDPNLGLVYAPSDGHTVYFDSKYGYKWQPQVDGNIVDVEWMLPRFYYEYKHP